MYSAVNTNMYSAVNTNMYPAVNKKVSFHETDVKKMSATQSTEVNTVTVRAMSAQNLLLLLRHRVVSESIACT